MEIRCQSLVLHILLVIASKISLSLARNDSVINEDNLAVESRSKEPYFVLPAISKSVLNDGKPFYLERDPETGNFDFNNKKTVGLPNNIDIDVKDLEKQNEIKSINPNFHDYLNLPVKYSASKSVFPFISGSYANLKYQGNNKGASANHKNYTYKLHTMKDKFSPDVLNKPTTVKVAAVTEKIQVPSQPTKTTVLTTASPSTTQSTTVLTSTTTPVPTTILKKISSKITTPKPDTTVDFRLTSEINRRPTRPPRPTPTSTEVPTTQQIVTQKTMVTQISSSVQRRPPVIPYDPTVPVSQVPSGFKPMPSKKPSNSHQKISFEQSDPSTMSLSELFNVFGKVDTKSLTNQQQQYIPYDSNGTAISQPQTSELKRPVTERTTTQKVPTSTIAFFPTDDDHILFDTNGDQYVKYDIQGSGSASNPNLVQFKDISSINNVLIHPGQSSASFVLGSKQSFDDKPPAQAQTMGVVGSSFEVPISQGYQTTFNTETGPKKDFYQANEIRFPSDVDDKFEDAPIVIGSVKIKGPDVPLPYTQQQQQDTTLTDLPTVMFPPKPDYYATLNKNSDYAEVNVPVKFAADKVSTSNVNDIYEKISDKNIRQEQNQGNGPVRPNLENPPPVKFNQLRPMPPGPPGPPNVYRIMPYNPMRPNVLPQFRPNAKTSYVHGPPMIYKDVGNTGFPHGELHGDYKIRQKMPPHRMPVPKVGLPMIQKPEGQYPQRRISVQKQYNFDEANRRVYNPPIPQKQLLDDTSFLKPPPPPGMPLPGMLPPPSGPVKLGPVQSVGPVHLSPVQLGPSQPGTYFNRYPNYPRKPQPAALQSLNPPKGPEIIKTTNASALEPVITLQQIVSKKGLSKLNFPSPKQESPLQLDNDQKSEATQGSLYVVYPVPSADRYLNNNSSNTVNEISLNQRETLQPPITPFGNEYQNTPFSVDSHFEQKPILVLKEKKKTKPQSQFPYLIERPDPSVLAQTKPKFEPLLNERTDYTDDVYNIGEKPKHDAISSTLMRVTDRPIAIAYTPTTKPPRFYYNPYNRQPSNYPSYDNRLNYQTNSAEIMPYRESYELEAPFYASTNLDKVIQDVNIREGWSVINDNKTDRPLSAQEPFITEAPVKRFDPDNFEPILESGFQPIYPKNSQFNEITPVAQLKEIEIVPKNNEKTETVETTVTTTSSEVPVAVSTTTEKESTTKKEEESSIHLDSLEALLKEFIGGDDDSKE